VLLCYKKSQSKKEEGGYCYKKKDDESGIKKLLTDAEVREGKGKNKISRRVEHRKFAKRESGLSHIL